MRDKSVHAGGERDGKRGSEFPGGACGRCVAPPRPSGRDRDRAEDQSVDGARYQCQLPGHSRPNQPGSCLPVVSACSQWRPWAARPSALPWLLPTSGARCEQLPSFEVACPPTFTRVVTIGTKQRTRCVLMLNIGTARVDA